MHKLVDITSTGGNYLLNVGPTGQGEIVQAMQKPLLETGKWLEKNGRAIYNTVRASLSSVSLWGTFFD